MVENNELSSNLLALAAARAATRPHLFASVIARFVALNDLTEQELCAQLRCNRDTLNHLRLCGRPDPDPPAFALDIQRVAEKLGLNATALASLVREVDAADAFNKPGKNIPFSSTSGMLQAARDRDVEHDRGDGPSDPQTDVENVELDAGRVAEAEGEEDERQGEGPDKWDRSI